MTEKEKYEKWRQIAFSMAEEKRIFLDEPFEKVEKNVSVNVRKPKSLRVQANK